MNADPNPNKTPCVTINSGYVLAKEVAAKESTARLVPVSMSIRGPYASNNRPINHPLIEPNFSGSLIRKCETHTAKKNVHNCDEPIQEIAEDDLCASWFCPYHAWNVPNEFTCPKVLKTPRKAPDTQRAPLTLEQSGLLELVRVNECEKGINLK